MSNHRVFECAAPAGETSSPADADAGTAGTELTNDGLNGGVSKAAELAGTDVAGGPLVDGAVPDDAVGVGFTDGVELCVDGFADVALGVGARVGVGVGVGEVAPTAPAGNPMRYTPLCTPSLPTSTDFSSRVKAIASSCCCSVTSNAVNVPVTPTDQYARK